MRSENGIEPLYIKADGICKWHNHFLHLNTSDAAKKIRIGDVEMSVEGSDAEDAGETQNLRYVRAT